MTRNTKGQADPPNSENDDPIDCHEDCVRTLGGFASALCYLATEAKQAGWHRTHEHLEESYATFIDEIQCSETGIPTLPQLRLLLKAKRDELS